MKKERPCLVVQKVMKGEGKPRISKSEEMIFVNMLVNGKPIRAMVDTGTTHKYLSSMEVSILVLSWTKAKVLSRQSTPQLVQLDG